MTLPEIQTRLNAARFDETLAVGGPVLCLTGWRRIDQFDDLVEVVNLCELRIQLTAIKAMLVAHLGDELADRFPLAEIRELGLPIASVLRMSFVSCSSGGTR
jgi:hypothetical protein